MTSSCSSSSSSSSSSSRSVKRHADDLASAAKRSQTDQQQKISTTGIEILRSRHPLVLWNKIFDFFTLRETFGVLSRVNKEYRDAISPPTESDAKEQAYVFPEILKTRTHAEALDLHCFLKAKKSVFILDLLAVMHSLKKLQFPPTVEWDDSMEEITEDRVKKFWNLLEKLHSLDISLFGRPLSEFDAARFVLYDTCSVKTEKFKKGKPTPFQERWGIFGQTKNSTITHCEGYNSHYQAKLTDWSSILINCKNLTHLNAMGCGKELINGPMDAACIETLKSLKVDNSFDKDRLNYFLKTFINLEDLDLGNIWNLPVDDFTHLKLRSLSLSNSSVTLTVLLGMFNLSTLQRLSLHNCRKITTYDFDILLTKSPNLRYLNLSQLTPIDIRQGYNRGAGVTFIANSLCIMAHHLPQLEELDLSGHHNFIGERTFEIVFPALRILHLQKSQIEDKWFLALTNNAPLLEKLDLTWCNQLTGNALNSFVKIPRPTLRSLNLEYCEITDNLLIAISENCTGLQEINLGQCSSITDRGLNALLKNCQQLKYINYTKCYRVTSAIETRLIQSGITYKKN